MKNDGINSFTFENFRYLSPPLLKSSIKWYDGRPLGQFLKEYAICRTPADLAKRCVVQPLRLTVVKRMGQRNVADPGHTAISPPVPAPR
jgi:hypothetical protein